MDAREYFERARAARRLIDGAAARLEAMRAREGARAQAYGPGGGARADDGMAAVDARIDYEAAVAREIGGYRADVADARAVCAGVRAANPRHPLWGDALELRYLEDMPWDALAAALAVSTRTAQAEARSALDWVDLVGIAAARAGRGGAQLP